MCLCTEKCFPAVLFEIYKKKLCQEINWDLFPIKRGGTHFLSLCTLHPLGKSSMGTIKSHPCVFGLAKVFHFYSVLAAQRSQVAWLTEIKTLQLIKIAIQNTAGEKMVLGWTED